MPGKVYCFNAYNEAISLLSVNGRSAGTVAGWAASGDTKYTPSSVAVARAYTGQGQSGPVFPNDRATQLLIEWSTFSVETSIDLKTLKQVSLEDDLILYIAVNQLALMTARGFVLITVPIDPFAKTEAAKAELQAIAAIRTTAE